MALYQPGQGPALGRADDRARAGARPSRHSAGGAFVQASIFTGEPGVGKTTIVKAKLRILSDKGVDIPLCAPTGRAARRMSEATGFETKTIHRLLEADPRTGGFRRDADNPID